MFVLVGTPVDVSEVKEYESRFGVLRSVTFALAHPDVPSGDGVWTDRFTAENQMIPEIVAAAEAGRPVHLLCRTYKRKGGKDGVWYITAVDKIVKS